MPEYHIENHLPHTVNVIPSPYFTGMVERAWEGREYVPRSAEATIAMLGIVRVAGNEVPVLQRAFTELIQDEGIPYDPDVLKLVSHETIAAAHRSGRPTDDLAYPYHILRDRTGRVIGCRGFGMPIPTRPMRRPEAALTAADIPNVGDSETWVNTANYPVRLYPLSAMPVQGDAIDASEHAPIVDLPAAIAPVDVTPVAEVDSVRSEQFGAPILRVRPNFGPVGIDNWPQNPDRLQFVHPIALRHAALLGKSLRYCVVAGGLLRDRQQGTVLGGTSLYVFDPDMLATDGI